MIEPIDKTQAIALMNEYGSKGVAFLFLIDFELQQPIVLRLDQIRPEYLLYDINGQSNCTTPSAISDHTRHISLQAFPISFQDYQRGFEYVQSQIKAGNSYLTNLTYPTSIDTNIPLKEIFMGSEARYRIWWKDRFTVFSPEIFVTIDEKGCIRSYPMKGTIDAKQFMAAQLLLDNKKEKAEHATIVDLIRNDLSIVAAEVRVTKYRYLEEIQTHRGGLLQSSSTIAGQLPLHYQKELGDIIFRLLPAGSISGAPKKQTIEIIQAAEHSKRGYYTGICGIFDGHKLDSGVMIRFVEQTDAGLVFRSGGGITAQSDAEEEYREMIDKVYFPMVEKASLINV
jgi:para-aminobenzoate synthetase component 1